MTPPLHTASVVIASYNYARYLGRAIESALSQSRRPLQVIVVDDGSADGSDSVIRSFGDRIQAVVKENGGHASAINAGCRLARGDAVLLLDADDELCPDAIDVVLSRWRPGAVMVHWRLSQIDADGHDVAGTVPAPWIQLDEGDVRARMLRTGGYATTITSGLALRRDALLRVLPIPEERFRQAADGYLVRAMAFEGDVQAIDRSLSRYRRHGGNDSEFGASLGSVAATLHKRIRFACNEHALVREMARARGYEVPASVGDTDPEFLLLRLESVKIAAAQHPIASDSPSWLLRRLVKAELSSSRSRRARVETIPYATALALVPSTLARRLVAWKHSPSTRPHWLATVAAWVGRTPLRGRLAGR